MAKRHIFYSYKKKRRTMKHAVKEKKHIILVLCLEVYDYSFFLHAYRYHMLRHQVQ